MMFFKASCLPRLVFVMLLCNLIRASEAQTPPVVEGLSYDFHNTSCPQLESIIRTQLQTVFNSDIGQAAGLLRLHFHDCFVQGCDASVLLENSTSGPDEQDAPPNLSLRAQAFVIIENLRMLVHNACNQTVSCSDITALAARDAVFLSGGPDYSIPLGRRDGLNFATRNATLDNLPAPTADTTTLLANLSTKGFDTTDVVALSGGHTIGMANCGSFVGRIFTAQDPTMDQTFFNDLRATCPTNQTTNSTFMDVVSPNVFDNGYYIDLMNRQGLFTSDQDLFNDNRTSGIVTNFAANQTLFFENFVIAMIKMGQLSVLTGTQGEIRANCSRTNIPEAETPPVVDGLSYDFHNTSCPQLESIIRTQLQTVFNSDIGQAAGLLRLHFHDCFVQGCDGSVLLENSTSGPDEQDAPPNLSLRAQAFVIIENLRMLVHNACNQTVSCSDITALAARDAVFLVNSSALVNDTSYFQLPFYLGE